MGKDSRLKNAISGFANREVETSGVSSAVSVAIQEQENTWVKTRSMGGDLNPTKAQKEYRQRFITQAFIGGMDVYNITNKVESMWGITLSDVKNEIKKFKKAIKLDFRTDPEGAADIAIVQRNELFRKGMAAGDSRATLLAILKDRDTIMGIYNRSIPLDVEDTEMDAIRRAAEEDD